MKCWQKQSAQAVMSYAILEDDIVAKKLLEVFGPCTSGMEIAPARTENKTAGFDAPEYKLHTEGTKRSKHRAKFAYLFLICKVNKQVLRCSKSKVPFGLTQLRCLCEQLLQA